MDSALAWVGRVAEWFGQFIPRLRVIRLTHLGVKFVRGKRLRIIQPGLTVYWPLVTDYFDYPRVRQQDQLREQTVVTTDDRTVVVGGMVVYDVTDMAKLMGETYHAELAVKDLALTAVHDVCCKLSWTDLKTEQRRGTLDTKLKNEAAKALEPYGVRVLKLMLTDLSPCRVYRLVQTTAKGED